MAATYPVGEIVEEIVSRVRVADASCSIPVGISGRHVHLGRDDLEKLFGSGYSLTHVKDLKQPGQFAAKETVCIAGPKGSFAKVRVLGPLRAHSQIEISAGDAHALGVSPPLRLSGDLRGAAAICAIGPKGMATLEGSLIIARRHLHMTPGDAKRYGVMDGDTVSVRGAGEKRCLFYDTAVRVTEASSLEFHIDMDEANASGLQNDSCVQIVGRDSR